MGRNGACTLLFLCFDPRIVLYATIFVHIMKDELTFGLEIDALWSTFSMCVLARPYWVEDWMEFKSYVKYSSNIKRKIISYKLRFEPFLPPIRSISGFLRTREHRHGPNRRRNRACRLSLSFNTLTVLYLTI